MKLSYALGLLLLMWLSASGESLNSSDQTTNSKNYQLGPGDVIGVSILGVRDFERGPVGLSVTVSNSGKIHLPFLGILTVTDKSATQLEQEIGQSLKKKGFIKEPQVQVNVVDYRAHTVYILGEVEQPGQYMLRGETYLTDLLTWGWASSGGKTAHETQKVGYFYRRKSVAPAAASQDDQALESPIEEAVKIDFNQLFSGSHPELNFRLQGGEVLYVPKVRPGVFYIIGEINRSGVIEIPQGKEVLASHAIAQAGGPLKTAKMSKALLIRYDEHGTRQELPVNFDAILKGKVPDFAVVSGDIVFIPGSEAKTLGYGLLHILPAVASRSVY